MNTKKVLVMCTQNSCRSIIAEALINRYLDDIEAYSCGVNPNKKVNPNAKKILVQNSCWLDRYHPKDISKIINIDFDLVITVCDNAKNNCPVFPKNTKTIHISFDDPNLKDFKAFIDTYNNIKEILLPKVQLALFDDTVVCFCKKIYKQSIIQSINNGANTLQDIKKATTACTGSECKDKNPSALCCSKDIKKIIKQHTNIKDKSSCDC